MINVNVLKGYELTIDGEPAKLVSISQCEIGIGFSIYDEDNIFDLNKNHYAVLITPTGYSFRCSDMFFSKPDKTIPKIDAIIFNGTVDILGEEKE